MKKITIILSTMLLACIMFSQTYGQGVWTPLANQAPDASMGGMLLLSDGSVITKSASGGGPDVNGFYAGNIYDKLTPDAHGSYINGTWSQIAPMIDTRLFYSSQILKDGRVYVAGGEYGTGFGDGEVYNPLTNTWTEVTDDYTNVYIIDANSEILDNGQVLEALADDTWEQKFIYDPASNSYSLGLSTTGSTDESMWVKLPDGSILFVDQPYPDITVTTSERYIPSLGQWVADAPLPVQLYDPFDWETGTGFLLPDGRVFFFGSSGHTVYYTPSGNASPGSWAAGPDIPDGMGTPDAPAAMMMNGKILCAFSYVPSYTLDYSPPTVFQEFDYLTNTFTPVSSPDTALSEYLPSYVSNMLDLPDGSVLFNFSQIGATQYYVYTPTGSPLAAGKPTVSGIRQIQDSLFSISGTLFNGISEGAAYGDDWQMATNYPIIRLTSGSNVYYARTANWNSTGVQRGNAVDSTQFALPLGLPVQAYSLVVIANGISSDPVAFNPFPPCSGAPNAGQAWAADTANCYPFSASIYLLGADQTGVTYQWQSSTNNRTWSNIAGAFTQNYTPAGSINTTTSFRCISTCTNSGKSSTSSAVHIHIYKYRPAITVSGSTSVCEGASVHLTANRNSHYLWSTGETTQSIFANVYSDYYGIEYWVVNPDSNYCIGGTDSVNLIAKPAPLIYPNGQQYLCPGTYTTLYAYSYVDTNPPFIWSNGATTESITVSAAGTYNVTMYGCPSLIPAEISYYCNAPYQITGNAFVSGSGKHQSVTIAVQWYGACGIGYQLQYRIKGTTSWTTVTITGDITSENLTGLKTGTWYECQVRSQCSSTRPVTYSAYSTIESFYVPVLRLGDPNDPGIASTDADGITNLSLYPNPANQNLNIRFQSGIGNGKLQIVNMLGQLILQQDISSEGGDYNANIDVSQLTSGIYLLMIVTDNDRASARFVKE